jgi:hypothetical protein
MGVTYADELITPDIARKYLAMAAPNRKVRPGVVTRYVADMEAGKWSYTGDPIRFDVDGELFDGQHRLLACIEADVSFRSLVVRGLPKEVMKYTDVGARRSLGDVLKLQGETEINALGAAIVTGWRWEQGVVTDTSVFPTISESLSWLEANPEIRQGTQRMKFSVMLPMRISVGPAGAFGMRLLTSGYDQQAVDRFLDGLRKGVNMSETDPRFAMRRWAMNMVERKASMGKPPPYYYLALLIKTWNFWSEGRQVKHIVWKPTLEDFPELREAE